MFSDLRELFFIIQVNTVGFQKMYAGHTKQIGGPYASHKLRTPDTERQHVSNNVFKGRTFK
jgi:hypothetical protein